MIRKAEMSDFNIISEIYETARSFMRENGNPTQWSDGYPQDDIIENTIAAGDQYVICRDNGEVFATFSVMEGDDPTYEYIDGKWRCDSPYAAIHRVASDTSERGVFKMIFNYVSDRYDHIRIDTHENNIPMQKAVLSCGFTYCGIIYVYDKTPRLAYEWLK